MTSTATSLLRLENQSDDSTDWGTKADNVFARLEEAIAATSTIAVTGGSRILSALDFVQDESRSPFIDVTGTLASDQSIIVPNTSKSYIFTNNTTGSFALTIKTASGLGISIPRDYAAPIRVKQDVGAVLSGALVNPITGEIYGSASGNYLAPGYSGTARTVQSKLGDTVNIKDYGGAPDGVTPTRAAVVLAVAAGAKTIIFDEGASSYYWESPYQFPSGVSFKAGNGLPKFTFNPAAATSRFFTMPGRTGCQIVGIWFDGLAIPVRNDAFIVVNGGSTECLIDRCKFDDCPGGGTGCVVFSGNTTQYCTLSNSRFNRTANCAIGLSAALYCDIVRNTLYDTRLSFAIRVGELASWNLIAHNRSRISGAESIGIYHHCDHNRVDFNHCEAANDNGISITGRFTSCTGNQCYLNYGNGIGIWGEFNTVVGNICRNNGQGNSSPLWAADQVYTVGQTMLNSGGQKYQCSTAGTTASGGSPIHTSGTVVGSDGVGWTYLSSVTRSSGVWIAVGYSGIGQYNYVAGNICDDDQVVPTQWYGQLIEGSGGYSAWANGQVVPANDGQRSYTVNGLNVYFTTNGGTTATGSAPVHTSGTVTGADLISWEYRNTFNNSAAPRNNVISFNPTRRTKSSVTANDLAGWLANTLLEHGKAQQNVTNGVLYRNLPVYADDAAAAAGGQALDSLYRTAAGIVHSRVA